MCITQLSMFQHYLATPGCNLQEHLLAISAIIRYKGKGNISPGYSDHKLGG